MKRWRFSDDWQSAVRPPWSGSPPSSPIWGGSRTAEAISTWQSSGWRKRWPSQSGLGFTWLVGLIESNRGSVAWERGDNRRAAVHLRDALAAGMAHNDQRIVAHVLEGLAGLSAAKGDVERAGRMNGAAATLREAIGTPVPMGRRSGLERTAALVRAAHAEDLYKAAWDEGRSLPFEQAIDEAGAFADALVDVDCGGRSNRHERRPV